MFKVYFADTYLIYIWVNRRDYVFNNQEYPFLQNMIGHALEHREVYCIYYQKHNMKYYRKIGQRLRKAGINNLKFINFKSLFKKNEKNILDLITAFMNGFENLANAIDTVKIIIASKLEILNLKYALILDMDTNVPPFLNITTDLEFLPLCITNGSSKTFIDDLGISDSFIENGAIFVIGSKNQFFSDLYDYIVKYYWEKIALSGNKHDEPLNYFVYRFFHETTIRRFTNCSGLDLYQKFNRFYVLPQNLKVQLFQMTKIKFFRGNSWRIQYPRIEIPLHYERNRFPLFPGNLIDLYERFILDKKLNNVYKTLWGICEKNYDLNLPFEWCNFTQKVENVFYIFIEKCYNTKDIILFEEIIKLMLKNKLRVNTRLVKFQKLFYENLLYPVETELIVRRVLLEYINFKGNNI